MAKNTYQERFQQRLDDYAKDFRVEELNQSNDLAQLRMLISTELMLESLQREIERIITSEDILEKSTEIKKLSDLIRDAAANVTVIQKTLGIDRRTRKSEETDNFAAWLQSTKQAAKSFIDERLVKVYCPDCKVLVARFSAVHEHTSFRIEIQCSQCKKIVRAKREERDIWFDLKNDSAWRRAHPVEIINPEGTKKKFTPDTYTETLDDDVILEGGDIFAVS